ncbi:MAG: SPOR domain-containing protein [Treponema sp.]|jgi:DedD protein|nr:SPOR domain-containing protein [Treponema sp.]
MEQKKLLLVAISVGVFFVIAIGAAILVFRPQAAPAVSTGTPIPAGVSGANPAYGLTAADPVQPVQPEVVNPSDYMRDGIQGLQPAPEGTGIRDNNFYVNSTPARNEGGVVITVESKPAAGVPDAPPAGKAVSAARPAAVPVSAKPAARPSPAPAKPAPAPAKAPAAKPAAQAKTYDDYWVQTGSFTAKARAEGVKETLAAKGIASIIENRDVEGTTYFRVRVGPYTSQNEADYWLTLIKSINGFEDSQVWKSQSKR